MKGVIFNILEEMVIDRCGLDVWSELLEECQTEGIYTAGESYPDSELLALVDKASQSLEIPVPTLITGFGEFMFGQLVERYPIFVEQSPDLFTFLKSVDSVIHMEVRKLYDSPNLPEFTCFEKDDGTLLMEYRSPRRLCLLAEGLIRGAASHYATPIQLTHAVCMHRGDDHCALEIKVAA